jgi:signal transduction histidine kinase
MAIPGSSSPRSTLIVASLLSTLVLAALLALQAVAAAQYHRATAEGVLQDYASAAADELAQRISQDFEYYGFYPIFRILAGLDAGRPGSPLPDSTSVWQGASEYERRALQGLRGLFRLDLATGSLVASHPAVEDPALEWLADTIPIHASELYQSDWRSAVLVRPGGGQEIFVYSLHGVNDDTPVSAYGCELHPDSTRALLRASVRREPLLAPSLLRGIDAESLMVVQLVDATGQPLYASHADSSATDTFAAVAAADPRLGGISAQVTLRSPVAHRLIIGGLPKSRLPFILGLLSLAAALIVIALLQLRREQELARLRTEFVSNVSHELRTPLAQIRMFAETLLLGRVRSQHERQRSLEIIDKEARRLTHLVDNVLQFSRAERHATTLTPEPTRLASLIRDVLDTFTPATDPGEVQFRVELDETVEADVDRGAVQQMVLNLLDNAVKYGPGKQTVGIGLEAHGDSVRIRVDDQGPGIPQADRERVWQRFARLERERKSTTAGTGIGLSVVRDLATLHHGTTWAEEAPRGGARFVIELPNGRRSAPTPAGEPETSQAPGRIDEIRTGVRIQP